MATAVAYAAAPAAAAPCPETLRASSAARPRTGGGLRVCVPLRLVMGAQYGDAALSVHIKIAALDMRPAGCRARVATLATYLSLSKTAVERALTQLNSTGTDGIAEVITIRKTSADGDGESAHRSVRPVDTDRELFVWLPARAATSLTPRQLRLYAAISYAQARRIPLALSDLQDVVRHQYGDSAGEPLGPRQVMRIIGELEELGWVTVHRRQGPRGRHLYEAHRRPLHPVLDDTAEEPPAPPAATAPAPATPDIHDGSAPRTPDGSPHRDDHRTDRHGRKSGEVGGGIRRRRPTGSRPAAHGEKRSNTAAATFAGPGADLAPRTWQVLEPVRHLLPGIQAFMLRRIDTEISRQLAQGAGAERLQARLTARYASTEPPRDPGRWILGAGLVRRGCGLTACESGTLWHTSEPCQVCADNRRTPAAAEPDRAQQRPVLEEQPVRPAPGPWVPWVPATDDGQEQRPDLTREQLRELRAAATPDSVRKAIGRYGRAGALYLYGHRLVMPHLTEPDLEGNPAHAPAQ